MVTNFVGASVSELNMGITMHILLYLWESAKASNMQRGQAILSQPTSDFSENGPF